MTLTVNVTGYDLKKSFVLKNIDEITSDMHFPIHV